MYKFNNKRTPRILHDLIKKPVHQCPAEFSKANFSLKKFFLSTTEYSIFCGGQNIWNNFLTNHYQEPIINITLLRIKSTSLDAKNERKYFKITLFANMNS